MKPNLSQKMQMLPTVLHQRGLTLIELIMFIVIVGVALAGVLTVLNHTTRHSADPMIRKQALAVAEAVLEEVMLQPFTSFDPDDETLPEVEGPDTNPNTVVETRTSTTDPFDNVNDYYQSGGLPISTNIVGNQNTAYGATVYIEPQELNGIGGTTWASDALLITVEVTAGSETIRVQGYRTRHSPNFGP